MKSSCLSVPMNMCFVLMSFWKRSIDFLILFVGYLCLMQKFRPRPKRDRAPGGMSFVDLHRLCIAMLFCRLK